MYSVSYQVRNPIQPESTMNPVSYSCTAGALLNWCGLSQEENSFDLVSPRYRLPRAPTTAISCERFDMQCTSQRRVVRGKETVIFPGAGDMKTLNGPTTLGLVESSANRNPRTSTVWRLFLLVDVRPALVRIHSCFILFVSCSSALPCPQSPSTYCLK